MPKLTPIKLRRLVLELLATDVAKRAGIGRSRYSLIENDRIEAKPPEVEAIEKVFLEETMRQVRSGV